MFSTCLFCQSALGANSVIEHFPVGRRLAFDADQGRLWVVCPKCERWNLSPLEERWEAIEEAERQYRQTTRRVATDNIALARLREGLELVRIGRPLRPEFAAWRYGDQFGRRRRRMWGYGLGGVAAVAGVAVAGPAVGLTIGGLSQAANFGALVHHYWLAAARVRGSDGETYRLSRADLYKARLTTAARGELLLTLDVQRWGAAGRVLSRFGVRERRFHGTAEVLLRGAPAQQALAAVLPALNRSGGRRASVEQAVRVVEDAGSPTRLLQVVQAAPRRSSLLVMSQTGESVPADSLITYTTPMRLALEMALHEDDERRAMAGELGALYARWEDAERIARIADRMLASSAGERDGHEDSRAIPSTEPPRIAATPVERRARGQ